MGVFQTATARRYRPALTVPAPLVRLRSGLLAKTGRAQPRKLAGAFVFAGILGASGIGALALTSHDDHGPPGSGSLRSSTGTGSSTAGSLDIKSTPEDKVLSDQPAGGSSGLHASVTSDGSSARVTVNGHSYEVPPNSSHHQEFTTPGGTAQIDISNRQSQTGSSTDFSSTYTSISSSANVSAQTNTDQSSSP